MDNSTVFQYQASQMVRVVYEPDGTPLFCGKDVAAVLGYGAPIKAVQRLDGAAKYTRSVRWEDGDFRMHRSDVMCLDEDGVRSLASYRRCLNAQAYRWVTQELIQMARQDRPVPPPPVWSDDDSPFLKATPPRPSASGPFDPAAFERKLDAIIAECVMLKAQLNGLRIAP